MISARVDSFVMLQDLVTVFRGVSSAHTKTIRTARGSNPSPLACLFGHP